mmetsp:Transcript_30523/g.51431  ORF Transcript_30523/g.51431 Transcript_30523/m.51431 type:complete len:475 (+) Transcript_30523:312-1736(+)|eukprot:CAMPEP_0198200756 /NCGR_PEP_ID=MMETSP1445-20131203/3708_1 /TAXON_ID=36898 /ORGANISM="Pyramimonas sp., Strain CCMP2087" /LENGTH=474 /DNA_ID=CAMNT_0043870901 /DNA_START=309 /DNA_END=1733 /DNA_ORIENTATION=+
MSRNYASVKVSDTLAGTNANPQWLDRRSGEAKVKNKVRVTRYWPGKAPDWAPDEDGEDSEEERNEAEDDVEEVIAKRAPPVLVERKDDPRLRRLAASRVVDRSAGVERRRDIHRAEVVSDDEDEKAEAEEADEQAQRQALMRREMAGESSEEDEDEDEDTLEFRRLQAKRRMVERMKVQQEEMPMEDEDGDDDEEDSSEYETDSEDEGPGGRQMLKPVFVKKDERETVVEREKIEEEIERDQQRAKNRIDERKVETRQLVVEEINRDAEYERANEGLGAGGGSDVDTDDETNEAEEYELWKARELKRIKRDRDLRETAFKEREELEMLRSMTEEERREWERKNPKDGNMDKVNKKWNFLQKYYHKGAFFQDTSDDKFGTAGKSEIYKRDYGEAVGEDAMDKSILPKVMQVRRGQFGRSGRSKWTHLVAEDTTSWDNPWNFNDPLRSKYTNKMAGMTQQFEKPTMKDLLKKGTTH